MVKADAMNGHGFREWILTDNSCSQYQKYLGDGQYLMVELV